jgi:hypothetical protein
MSALGIIAKALTRSFPSLLGFDRSYDSGQLTHQRKRSGMARADPNHLRLFSR